MSGSATQESKVVTWYRNRIGEPTTDDEVYGYWAFVTGILLAILGVVLFVASTTMTEGSDTFWTVRSVGYAVAAIGLPVALVGALIRMPLQQRATQISYLGTALCLAAVVWFVFVFPDSWPTGGPGVRTDVIGLYALGMLVISLGGVLVPLVSGRVDQGGASHDTTGTTVETTTGEPTSDEPADATDDGEPVDTDEVVSNARFEVYEDNAGDWRWRLRHQNGNIIADGGQGYSSRQKAQQGLNSVRRNAANAAQIQLESEAEPEAAADPEEPIAPLAGYESQATFELYEDRGGEWRWRLRHDNGNIVADSGEGYNSDRGARRGIRSVKRNAPDADYLEIDPTGFQVYQDKTGQWRWRFVHRNGNILADSGGGYDSRPAARDAARLVAESAADADVVEDGAGDGTHFEVYEDNAGETRWRLVHESEGQIADSGEGYTDRSEGHNAVERVQEYAPEADILEFEPASFEIYEDKGGEWRWRLRHRNGNIIADGGEGYASRPAARDAVDKLKLNAPDASEVRE